MYETDPSNLTTAFVYDDLGRLTQTNYPDSTNSQITYDSRNRVSKVTDAKGTVVTNTYDDRDRLTDVNGAEGSHVHNVYDLCSNTTIVTVSRENGNTVTNYTYDLLNRLSTVWDTKNSSNRTTTLNYDAVGRKTSMVDRLGHTITYTYDDLDRLTDEENTSDLSELNNHYTYDEVGNRLSMSDLEGITTYDYNNIYQMKTSVTHITATGTTALTSAKKFTYDLTGKRLTLDAGKSDLDGNLVSGQTMSQTFSYYANGWLLSESDGSRTTSYEYLPTSEKSKAVYPNGTETIYAYNFNVSGKPKNHRLQKLTNRYTSGQTVISSFEYTYDNVGNRLTMIDTTGTTTYTYDNLYRLSTVTYPSSRYVTYSYDKAGNRLSMTDAGTTTNYSYDEVNQLISTSTSGTTLTYAYDLCGNTTSTTGASITKNYTWNISGEMTCLTITGTSNATNTMKYNGEGMRTRYISNAGETKSIYDGLGTILDLDSSNNITKKYYSGVRMVKISGSAVEYFYLYDGMGNVVNLTDDDGTVIETYQYDAFGKQLNSTSGTDKKKFSGKEFDDDSGLYYFLARYYDPTIGRFLSEDPVPNGNFFVYCDNNPVNMVDPDGRESCWDYAEKIRKEKDEAANKVGENLDTAKTVAENATSMATGAGGDAYTAATGKDIISGEEQGRGLAAVSVLTGGILRKVHNAEKIALEAEKVARAVRKSEAMAVKQLEKQLAKEAIKGSEEAVKLTEKAVQPTGARKFWGELMDKIGELLD